MDPRTGGAVTKVPDLPHHVSDWHRSILRFALTRMSARVALSLPLSARMCAGADWCSSSSRAVACRCCAQVASFLGVLVRVGHIAGR